MNEVKEGSIYRHYKGGLYQVIKIGYHTEIKDIKCLEDIDDTVKMVIYKPIEINSQLGEVWWVRPYSMFIETVVVNGKEQPRFAKVVHPK